MTLLPGFEPISGAEFSPSGIFRYRLWRVWNSDLPRLAVCMLNPGTADAEKNDPSVRRCIGFAKAWGHGGLVVINMFAFRATDPQKMFGTEDPIGPRNDWIIQDSAIEYGEILVAWGAGGKHKDRAGHVLGLLEQENAKIYCLGKTKHGYPKHPLYVRTDQEREIF